MIAEHRRPLAAFILVALACALVVVQSLRTATFQRLVDGGLPLTVLVPIAPDMLFTIDASGHNGRGGDLPYVGRAVVAVSRPAPPSTPVTTTVATVPISSSTAVVRTVATSAVARSAVGGSAVGGSAVGGSTRAAGRHHAPARRATTATSGTPTVAPARGTQTLSQGRGHHVETVVAKSGRTHQKGPSHQLKRAQHAAEKAIHRQAVHNEHAGKAKTEHPAKSHQQKQHPQKQHHKKQHHKHEQKQHHKHEQKQHHKRH